VNAALLLLSAPAPVAVFAYARPDHLRATLDALAANELAERTELVIFSDAPKDDAARDAVRQARAVARAATGFAAVRVVERERNYGLADSIVDGVTALTKSHGRVIVLEDDIVTAPCFLRYMNQALERYADQDRVMHVAAHMFDIDPAGLPEAFFLGHSSCWGWATWKRAWDHFSRDADAFVRAGTPQDVHRFNLDGAYDYWGQLLANRDGRLKTWAVYWYASVYSKGGLCLHPRASLVENIGHDGSGANCLHAPDWANKACGDAVSHLPDRLRVEDLALARVQAHLRMLTGKAPVPCRKGLLNTLFTRMRRLVAPLLGGI